MEERERTYAVMSAIPVVRVAIFNGEKFSDMALPTKLPIREILPKIGQYSDIKVDHDFSHTHGLSLIGGESFSHDTNLDTVGVIDGDILVLKELPVGPPAEPVIEDIADAARIYALKSQKLTLSQSLLRSLPAVFAVVSALVAYIVLKATCSADGNTRTTAASVMGIYALINIIATIVIPRALSTIKGECAIVAGVFIGLTAMVLMPFPQMGPKFFIAAVAVFVWSVLMLLFLRTQIATFTAGVWLSGITAVVFAITLAVGTTTLTVGSIIIGVAAVITYMAPNIAALMARFPLPVIPAAGDPIPELPDRSVLADIPARVKLSVSYQLGIIVAATIAQVVGSLVVLHDHTTFYPVLLVAVAAGASLLRARIWDNSAVKITLLLTPLFVSAAVTLMFSVQGKLCESSISLAVLVVLGIAWFVTATNVRLITPEQYSLPMRRLNSGLSMVLDVAILPLIAYLSGIYSVLLQ